MELTGGTVKSQEPGITSANRKQRAYEGVDNKQLNDFLATIYSFKSKFWAYFLDLKGSQSPTIINVYMQLLGQIYNCIVNEQECIGIYEYKHVREFVTKMRAYKANNSVRYPSFNYYLRQNLLIYPFAYNMKAAKI